MSPIRLALYALISLSAGPGLRAAPEVPLAPGVTFVLAVSNAGPAEKGPSLEGVLHGDYEMPVAITAVDSEGITLNALLDGYDAAGIHRQGVIPRLVRQKDLGSSHLQVFGFYSDDPKVVDGATALGPSLAVTRALAKGEVVEYAFRNFVRQDVVSGTLSRPSATPAKFPVLLNGQRVVLDAMRAKGHLGGGTRPFEMLILDHPRHPLSLRIAWGARGAGFPFKPEFAREIVRIDFPDKEKSLAEALQKDCRVELPGIYFDFNLATLKPQSRPALQEIALVLQQSPQQALRIEGHTDNIGTDAYNADLSARRAAAVKEALVRDFRVDGRALATVGHGESKPLETNDTLAGRARNRRVELVCAQP